MLPTVGAHSGAVELIAIGRSTKHEARVELPLNWR
jgi:hypothetical protein